MCVYFYNYTDVSGEWSQYAYLLRNCNEFLGTELINKIKANV